MAHQTWSQNGSNEPKAGCESEGRPVSSDRKLSVAGQSVDHSAVICLFPVFTVQPPSRDLPHCCPEHFCLLILPLFSVQLPTSLTASLYSVLMSLVTAIGLHG